MHCKTCMWLQCVCLLGFFPFKRSVARNSLSLLDKSVSAFPSFVSYVVSGNLSHCDRSYCQRSYCVWKVSGLPWDAVWNTAGCGILQGACHVRSLGLLRVLEQRKGMHIRRAQLFTASFHSPSLFQRGGTPWVESVRCHPWGLPKLPFLVCW